MGNRWLLTAGPRPFALTRPLDKLEVPPGSPLTFRWLVEREFGHTCHELIVVERVPAGIDLSSDERFLDMLDQVGVPAPVERVGDAYHEMWLIRVNPDRAELPVPVAVVAHDE
jgi:hypothetical protein